MTEQLQQQARKLLDDQEVNLIIGYGEGSARAVRAVFVRSPEETEKLILDERCTANLAVYLNKKEIRALGKPAIVARPSVQRSIVQLAVENQLANGDITVIGIDDDGTLNLFSDLDKLGEHVLAQAPLRGEDSPESLHSPEIDEERVRKLSALPMEERFAFWMSEFAECLKCYACRAACPLCYCERCTVDCNQPQWVSVPAHPLGNLEWHVMRAMHLAGRCTECGACYEACPVDIPLHLLTQKMHENMEEAFGTSSGEKKDKPVFPLNSFRPDDKEDFFR